MDWCTKVVWGPMVFFRSLGPYGVLLKSGPFGVLLKSIGRD